MTGNLTIGTTAADKDVTVVGGAGDDEIAVKGNSAANATESLVYGGAGDDTISATVTDGAATEVVKLYGEAGNDTITGSATADTIDGGAGDDKIVATVGVDAITLGSGADTYSLASGTAGVDVISDFLAGTDTIVLTGAGEDIDLTDLEDNLTTNTYKFDGTTAFETKLTGVTATDLSDSIQLGSIDSDGLKSEYDLTLLSKTATAANATIVAGDKDDVIKAGGTTATTTGGGVAGAIDNVTHTITLGAGSDTLVLENTMEADADTGTNEDTTTVVVTDLTAGTDKVVFEGTAAGTVDLTSVDVNAGVYDIDGAGTFAVTLKNGATNLTATDAKAMFQLGSADAEFVAATGGTTFTGGTFDDFIKGAGVTDKINFIDNGGMDTITTFTGGADQLSFNLMTGITATSDTDLTAQTSKLADASDGAIFLFGDATVAHAGTAKVDTFTVDEDAAVTADTILADVADFLNANLGTSDGESYVAILADSTTDSYVYLITADTDGIQADDIKLIGSIDDVVNTGDVVTGL
ncbi:MAG: hypothetical protein C0627_00540 [Sulfurimonas sp.]|nr:MAG: hypothetical protein C0627_00540 [Sulfurimonas sp.]